MSAGFTFGKHQGGASVPSWIGGAPEKSLWTGVKLRGKTPLEITTWRCKRCGFLESYAPSA